jgi:hypothetical protein
MSQVAVLTFGIFHNGIENTTLPTFDERAANIFERANRMPGFIKLVADKSYHDEPISTFVTDTDITGSSELLSLWTHLEPIFAFTYKGIHAEALNKRSQWFVKGAWPAYTLWWVDDDHIPDWHEAYERHHHLHQHGATAFAFDFKQPFDAAGQPVDRILAKSIAQSSSLSHQES